MKWQIGKHAVLMRRHVQMFMHLKVLRMLVNTHIKTPLMRRHVQMFILSETSFCSHFAKRLAYDKPE